ncbi:hypothetical protein PTKIN_Ptkin16aG0100300 [Pterospermum kingtungense]
MDLGRSIELYFTSRSGKQTLFWRKLSQGQYLFGFSYGVCHLNISTIFCRENCYGCRDDIVNTWIRLQYERPFKVCCNCGIIGHSGRHCNLSNLEIVNITNKQLISIAYRLECTVVFEFDQVLFQNKVNAYFNCRRYSDEKGQHDDSQIVEDIVMHSNIVESPENGNQVQMGNVVPMDIAVDNVSPDNIVGNTGDVFLDRDYAKYRKENRNLCQSFVNCTNCLSEFNIFDDKSMNLRTADIASMNKKGSQGVGVVQLQSSDTDSTSISNCEVKMVSAELPVLGQCVKDSNLISGK